MIAIRFQGAEVTFSSNPIPNQFGDRVH